jgi:hypothetical protein
MAKRLVRRKARRGGAIKRKGLRRRGRGIADHKGKIIAASIAIPAAAAAAVYGRDFMGATVPYLSALWHNRRHIRR